jgi:hypothetical protein
MLTLVDGYPVPDDDPDYVIQLKIDEYLSGPANMRTFGSTAGHVLKDAGSAEERYRWLMPLLLRTEWLPDHPKLARPHWAMHLMAAVRLLLNHNREQTELELLTLLGYTGVFRRLEQVNGFAEIPPRMVRAFRRSPNKQAGIEALESACFELEQFSTVHSGRFAAELGMALLADPAAPASPSPCWSAPVAADLREMAKEGEAWRSLFVLADTQLTYPREPNAKRVKAALKRIRPDVFARRLNAWTTPLEGKEAYLSWRGVAVLKILLHGAIAAPIPELQPSLTRIAKAKWRQTDRARLADNMIVAAIVAQPGDFARPCLETLAAHAYSSENVALKVALAIPEKQVSPLGVDGYPLDERPQHALFQHRLDEWLRRPGDFTTTNKGLPDLRSLALRADQPDYPGLLTAILDRIEWVDKHRALVPANFHMTQALTRYLPDLQRLVNDVDRDSLLRLMNADANGALYCSPSGEILETVEMSRCMASTRNW